MSSTTDSAVMFICRVKQPGGAVPPPSDGGDDVLVAVRFIY